jgi:hypothetical protein
MKAINPVYTIEGERLIVSDAISGATYWAGKPLDAAVADVKAVPGSDRAVVLLDYMAVPNGPFQNLICVSPEGTVVWAAPLPSISSTEAYVSFDLGIDELRANSWDGYRVHIDLASGEILQKTFTK